MFFIQTTTDKNCKDVFNEIEKKIAQYSNQALNNVRYGFNQEVNMDNFEALLDYRDILIHKLRCDVCLKQYSTELIISKINKLLNTLC